MSEERTVAAVRREQQLLWGGTALIIAIVVVGAGMLAAGVHWYWTLLMIPISAIGALMTFEARESAHQRQTMGELVALREWLGEKLDGSLATVHSEHVALAHRQGELRVRLDEVMEEVQIGRNAERAEHQHLIENVDRNHAILQPRQAKRGAERTQARSPGSGRGRRRQPRGSALEQVIADNKNVVDIEDARIAKRINDKLRQRRDEDQP